jgi:1-acyl-sn-glycerol-3-phosphate acyltransferase
MGRPEGGPPTEPWYHIAKSVVLPPLKLWFNWRMEGLDQIPRDGPIIVAGNHLSYLDPFAHAYFVVAAGRRPRFLAKSELFENAFLRMVLLGAGEIPVQRGARDQSALQASTDALERGEILVVYPEGTTATTNEDFSPGRGKTGAVRLALATGVPIVPVATYGGQYVWRRSGRGSLKFARPILMRAGTPIDVGKLASDPDGPRTPRALTDLVMTELGALVADMRARYPRRWSQG